MAADETWRRKMPMITAIAATALMTKRHGDAVAVFMPFDDVNGVDGAAVDISPAAARQIAAELLNIADEIEDVR